MRIVTFFVILGVLLIFVLVALSSHIYLICSYIYHFSLDPLTEFLDLKSIRPELWYDLKENWSIIASEARAVRSSFSPIIGDQFFTTALIENNSWKKIYLKWYSEPPNYAMKLFPRTMELIGRHKCIKLAMFSLLEPGCIIKPHRGPFRGCYRVHLCLWAPKEYSKCFIRVNEKTYHWREGEIVAFDDTYIHNVINDTREERLVLFLDVERHMNMSFINKLIIKHIAPRTTRMNDELERANLTSTAN